MRKNRQPGLFDTETAGQGETAREAADLYALVAALRAAGYRCHRAGADHMLDGRRLSPVKFRAIAGEILRAKAAAERIAAMLAAQ